MADPLAETVDRVAPAPTNYFDRGQAETLISRYGNANRGAASARQLLETGRAVQSMKLNDDENRRAEERMKRDALLMDKSDYEYAQKKEADTMRGDFFKEFAKNVDPKDPDYNVKVTEFMANLPPSIQNDQGFRDLVGTFNRIADEESDNRAKLNEIGLRQKNAEALIRERAKYDKSLRFLKEEDYKNAPKDAEGNTDLLALGMLAKQRELEADVSQYGKKSAIATEAAKERIAFADMNDAQKREYKETEKFAIHDTTAFPNRVDMLRKQYGKDGKPAPDKILELEAPDAYIEARDWDKNKFEKEVNAAMAYDKPEDYVNLIPGLSDASKKRRQKVWEYANQNRETAATETPTAQTREIEVGGVKLPAVVEGEYEIVTAPGGRKFRRKITP